MRRLALCVLLALSLVACGSSATPTPLPTPDMEATKAAIVVEVLAALTEAAPTATATLRPTATSTATPPPTATATATATATPKPTSTPTATAEPTATATEAPPTDTPEPEPTATEAPAPADTAVPPTAAPEAAAAPTETPVPAAGGGDELAFTYNGMHYECQMRCMSSTNPIWVYRSFQVKVTMVNNSPDKTVDWDWEPARWFITDGANTRVETRVFEWGSGSGGSWQAYAKPQLAPGAGAEWTFVAAPIGEKEWVSAVEFEAWSKVYRQEFDLGPAGNAYDYRGFCGLMPSNTTCAH